MAVENRRHGTEPLPIMSLDCDSSDKLEFVSLTRAIDELSRLKDGWLEGRGVAPREIDFSRFFDELIESFPPESLLISNHLKGNA
jgi:hypothetical protein